MSFWSQVDIIVRPREYLRKQLDRDFVVLILCSLLLAGKHIAHLSLVLVITAECVSWLLGLLTRERSYCEALLLACVIGSV